MLKAKALVSLIYERTRNFSGNRLIQSSVRLILSERLKNAEFIFY